MRKPGPPSIITVAIITTITIIFWIFFSVYQILTGEVDVNIPPGLLKPLNPTLNQEILSDLKGKENFEKDDVEHLIGQIQLPSEVAEEQSSEVVETESASTPSIEPELSVIEELIASPSGEIVQ